MGGWTARTMGLVFALMVLGGASGCAYDVGQRLTDDHSWPAHATALGKVKIIVVGEPSLHGATHVQKINAAIREAVAKQPGTTVVSHAAPTMRAMAPGDQTALAEAKAEGADSVCVLTVGTYGGRLSIGIPVLLELENEVLYSLRILDVATGKMLLESVHYRRVGGAYQICDPTDAQGNLRKMLAGDFRH